MNCEGVRFVPQGVPAETLAVFMHPASTLQLLPMPQALARAGVHVLCAGPRYARNDSALVMEKVLLDLGAYVRHAREVWGYDKVVLCGWSGGGSPALFYQAQAEKPSITHAPCGEEVDLSGLVAADAVRSSTSTTPTGASSSWTSTTLNARTSRLIRLSSSNGSVRHSCFACGAGPRGLEKNLRN